jgi:glycosyltransferase involved in cell wall biosynthesis
VGGTVAVVHQAAARKSNVKTFVLTDIPSPYQVEFFNGIAAQDALDLSVAYLRDSDPERMWQRAPEQYDCWTLNESHATLSHAEALAVAADFAIFNYYNHPLAEQMIARRAATGKPWCFWGERPGLRKPQFAGAWFRRWKLKALRKSRAPIWGIGEFAVEQYRHEFGDERVYQNLPYFSNLDRFAFQRRSNRESSSRFAPVRSSRAFLFAGSFIERKGVDLLARAFVRLAREFPDVSLKIAGVGPLAGTITRTLASVCDRVEFAGFKHWNELPELYASADVLCVPSRYDGWGLVVPEGLAAGLPVIATERMGAALEFIRPGSNGWLIPASSEDAIFGAMREAATLTDGELTQWGRQARESVSEHTLAHGVDRFVTYAREAVNV